MRIIIAILISVLFLPVTLDVVAAKSKKTVNKEVENWGSFGERGSSSDDPFSPGNPYSSYVPPKDAPGAKFYVDPSHAMNTNPSSPDYLSSGSGARPGGGGMEGFNGPGATNSFSVPNDPSSIGGGMYGPMAIP